MLGSCNGLNGQWSGCRGGATLPSMTEYDVSNIGITYCNINEDLRNLIVIICRLAFVPVLSNHGKKSYSSRRKKARTRTSRSVSSEATCSTVLNSNKQHNRRSSTTSPVSVPSDSRSSFIRKTTRRDFLSPLDLRPEEKLKSIAFYIDNREEMVRHMFASLHRRELYELLPENLK
uniref:Retrotransposon protein n=1 Tax=Elaeophora elaphi TaxID=1147741 RepID=A0A0R3RWN0_9BILA